MTTLSDAALLAAEEAYDDVVRNEGTRSPYMNTRAFRAAFHAASAIETQRATTEGRGPQDESAVPKADAKGGQQ